MSRRIEDLNSIIQPKALLLIDQAKKKAGLDILIYRTFATWGEQDIIYAQGRTTPGAIITNARGGQSYHNYGLAFDFAVLKPGTKQIEWGSKADVDKDQELDYHEIGYLGEDLGFEWGARFTFMKGDLGHLQMSFGLSIKELQIFYIGGMLAINLITRMRY